MDRTDRRGARRLLPLVTLLAVLATGLLAFAAIPAAAKGGPPNSRKPPKTTTTTTTTLPTPTTTTTAVPGSGLWTVDPRDTAPVNAIHAALLPTGKVLLVEGSGNNWVQFDAGTFRTTLWDPVTHTHTNVPTPADFFCSGHAALEGRAAPGRRRDDRIRAGVDELEPGRACGKRGSSIRRPSSTSARPTCLSVAGTRPSRSSATGTCSRSEASTSTAGAARTVRSSTARPG